VNEVQRYKGSEVQGSEVKRLGVQGSRLGDSGLKG